MSLTDVATVVCSGVSGVCEAFLCMMATYEVGDIGHIELSFHTLKANSLRYFKVSISSVFKKRSETHTLNYFSKINNSLSVDLNCAV